MNVRIYWHYVNDPFTINETEITGMIQLRHYVERVLNREIIIIRMTGVQ